MTVNRWLDRFFAGVSCAVVLVAVPAAAQAAPGGFLNGYRWGYSIGWGGAGIVNTQTLTTTGKSSEVNRSEGPMILSLFIETLSSDTSVVGFEHSRGVNFLPYASGVSFSGFTFREYFFGHAPQMQTSDGSSTILIKRFVPFIGGSAGFATATVQRDAADGAPLVSGNGVYFGFRFGADYPTALGRGLRPEFVYNTTAYSGMFSSSTSTTKPAQLGEFSLQCAWYYDF